MDGEVYNALLNLCVWNKSNAGMGSHYRSKHEMVFVYRVGDASHTNAVELGKHGRTLNKVHLESLDNGKLAAILAAVNIASPGTGTLKRLKALLASVGDAETINGPMSSFYSLYDFRVACAHLGSAEGSAGKMKTVTERLELAENADLLTLYDALLEAIIASYAALSNMLGEGSVGEEAQST